MQKNTMIFFLWVYRLVRCQEGKTQKSANVRELPRGGDTL